MFRTLRDDQRANDQHDALISADFSYSRQQKAQAGDKSDELPTIPTDAARSAVCDRRDEGLFSPALVRVPTPQQP